VECFYAVKRRFDPRIDPQRGMFVGTFGLEKTFCAEKCAAARHVLRHG
jgi:hypothetical protein